MHYREFEVPENLRKYLRCVWEWSDPTPGQRVQTLYPDGCCELIVHLGTPPQRLEADGSWRRQASELFAAQQAVAVRLRSDAPVHCVGIRLQPTASALVCRSQLAGMLGQIVDLAPLDVAFAHALREAVMSLHLRADAQPLWDALHAKLEHRPLDRLVEHAVAELLLHDGDLRIARLAAGLSVSVRSLQTRFLAEVGLHCKEFARLLRLQAMLRQLDGAEAGTDMAQTALAHGYADQAHATRELRRVTGQTPARLLTALRERRDSDESVQLAAAFVRGHS